MQDNARETFQTAAQQDGTTQAPLAEIVELNNNTAMAVTGQALINASTKAPAHQDKHNAPAQDTKPAIADANGKTLEQMQTMMPKTLNAVIPSAIIVLMSMMTQEHLQRMHAPIPLTMTVT